MNDMPTDAEAVAALERLGLSNYQARAFISLYRLGTATARDIHEAADIPRSQVYEATDGLEERGLVNIQQSRPKLYRPVSLDRAKEHLTGEFERDRRQALEYLEGLQARTEPTDERVEEVWTVTGQSAIDIRVQSLIEGAADSIVVAASDPQYLPEPVRDALKDRLDAGVSVTGLSANAAVIDEFETIGTTVARVDQEIGHSNEQLGTRLLLVDSDSILLAVLSAEETAIWSVGSAFASVFGGMLRRGLLPEDRIP